MIKEVIFLVSFSMVCFYFTNNSQTCENIQPRTNNETFKCVCLTDGRECSFARTPKGVYCISQDRTLQFTLENFENIIEFFQRRQIPDFQRKAPLMKRDDTQWFVWFIDCMLGNIEYMLYLQEILYLRLADDINCQTMKLGDSIELLQTFSQTNLEYMKLQNTKIEESIVKLQELPELF